MYYTVQGNTAIIYNNFKWNIGNSLVDQWLGLGALTSGPQVQTLVSELRFCKLRGTAKKKKIKN